MKTLKEIGSFYKTDKVQNGYMEHYDSFFSPLRLEKLNVLEIGVKRESPDTPGACSLKAWKEYFPNSNIYGIDIDAANKVYEEERVEIFIGDQGDKDFLSNVVDKVKTFDIIIDDGSHVNSLTIASFNELFPHLKSKGIYVIEDLGCGYIDLEKLGDVTAKAKDPNCPYWWGMDLIDTKKHPLENHRLDFLNFIQSKLTNMDLGVSERWRNKFNLELPDVHGISFYSNICFITKI